jgi:Protein of unknown function (DUF433)
MMLDLDLAAAYEGSVTIRLGSFDGSINTRMHISRIMIIPDVCCGEPTIRATRITPIKLIQKLAEELTAEEIPPIGIDRSGSGLGIEANFGRAEKIEVFA